MIDASRGFTLIELLVVVAIIAIVMVIAMPSVSSYFQVSLESAARQMAATIKETYNTSVVTGKVHRLVYDLKGNDYWVEIGPDAVLLDTPKSREREERRKKFRSILEKAPAAAFTMDKEVTRKKIGLPAGAKFEDVVTQQSHEPITEGVAFTHFFPAGLTEQTIIHLTDNSKHHSSLVISPLIGRTDVYNRYVTSEEIFGK